jgi:hypothetical protein
LRWKQKWPAALLLQLGWQRASSLYESERLQQSCDRKQWAELVVCNEKALRAWRAAQHCVAEIQRFAEQAGLQLLQSDKALLRCLLQTISLRQCWRYTS